MSDPSIPLTVTEYEASSCLCLWFDSTLLSFNRNGAIRLMRSSINTCSPMRRCGTFSAALTLPFSQLAVRDSDECNPGLRIVVFAGLHDTRVGYWCVLALRVSHDELACMFACAGSQRSMCRRYAQHSRAIGRCCSSARWAGTMVPLVRFFRAQCACADSDCDRLQDGTSTCKIAPSCGHLSWISSASKRRVCGLICGLASCFRCLRVSEPTSY